MSFYLEYNDPVRIVWREGTENDPYVDKNDTKKIINNKIVLEEIPYKFTKVMIGGYTEINQDVYGAKKTPGQNEFIVNYINGIVTFNSSEEGKTVVATYKGKGYIQYPAERIFAHWRNPDVVLNLQQIIEMASDKIETMDLKTTEINTAIINTQIATDNANLATDNANNARIKTEQATSEANQATQDCLIAIDRAYDATHTTEIVWKEPVATYDDIAIIYPDPSNGWSTMCEDTGNRYRYDSSLQQWVYIENMTGSIPLANDLIDGLMSNQDYTKLRGIESGATADMTSEEIKTALGQEMKRKTIVFVFPKPDVGEQGLLIKFPHAGTIMNISGYCSQVGLTPTSIKIQKISQADFEVSGIWTDVLLEDMIIPDGNKTNNAVIISDDNVTQNDYFRINITELGTDIKYITIQIEIQI